MAWLPFQKLRYLSLYLELSLSKSLPEEKTFKADLGESFEQFLASFLPLPQVPSLDLLSS